MEKIAIDCMITQDAHDLTKLRYQGFSSTPFLWEETLCGLKQFTRRSRNDDFGGFLPSERLRLGNYVERFVSYQLQQDSTLKIVLENHQLIENKTTLGEIDSLFTQEETLYHLEIAYKFYLYKPDAGTRFLEQWVGPNLRDSLMKKITKVKAKQFPLLYSETGKQLLNENHLSFNTIKQRCFFKAQLFLPFQNKDVLFETLNKDCVFGFYLSLEAFDILKECCFYIPAKLDWLIDPVSSVPWMSFKNALEAIQKFHARKSAPLVWVQYPNGKLEKAFVTWWE